MRELLLENIDFIVKRNVKPFNQVSVGLINSNIHLNFQPEDGFNNQVKPLLNPNHFKLGAFSLLEKKSFDTFYK